jgi:hypothetical protein
MKTNLQKWKDMDKTDAYTPDGMPRMLDLNQLAERCERRDELLDEIFVHCKRSNTITINSTYGYVIGLERITTPLALLHWVAHLCQKNWMPREFVRQFIVRVSRIKGWDVLSSKCERDDSI